MTFTLTIDLGNSAMQTLRDVTQCLIRSRQSLADGEEPLRVGDGDLVLRDDNGNAVGRWEVTA